MTTLMIIPLIGIGIATLIAGIVSAIAGITGAAVSASSKKRSEERQNQYNINAEERQNQYNLDAERRQQGYIDEQNEYNSPAAQMQRMREAGLNPYLVDDPGNQGTINSASSVDAIPNTAIDIGSDLQNGLLSVGQGISSSMSSFDSALMEEKKRQLDMYKIDADIQKARDQLFESQRQFDLNYQLEQSDRAYQSARDIIEDSFRQKEQEIKSRGLSLEQQKFELSKVFQEKNFELAKAKDSRDAERHRLEMVGLRISNEHNRDAQDFFKKFELPNKQSEATILASYYKLIDSDKTLFENACKETLRLQSLERQNKISYAEYLRDAYKVWDDANTESSLFNKDNKKFNKTRYWVGRDYEINPYSGHGQAENPFMKMAKNFSQSK